MVGRRRQAFDVHRHRADHRRRPQVDRRTKLRRSPEQQQADDRDSFTHTQYRLLREQAAAQADIFGYANLYGVTVRARQEASVARD